MTDTRPTRTVLLAFARKFVPDVAENLPLEELQGGSLNFVWRIRSLSGKSYIIKYAPPYVASLPHIAFDNSRILFEAGILKAFQFRRELDQLNGSDMRPPQYLGHDTDRYLLLMEDVGGRPNLLNAVRRSDYYFADLGTRLGSYIARLHAQTYQNQWFAENFANLPVQQTRLQLQYNGCLEFYRRAALPDADLIGKRCRRLGEKLNAVGKCLIMGDLWPYSILPGRREIRLIDWELVHFGHPAQDVAHLAAHLWMMSQRASGQSQKKRIDQFRQSFITSYRMLVSKLRPDLITAEDGRDFQIHFGAEILARTLGNFQQNYLYDGLPPDHPVIRAAAEEARKWILGKYEAFQPQP